MKLKFLFIALCVTALSIAQKGTITGTILDKEFDNDPLAFANVTIKGTTKGTTTDSNGKFSLSVDPGSYTVIVGFLGYKSQEFPITIKANEKKVINCTLEAGGGVELEDIVIEVAVTKEKESVLLQEQQKAVEIKQAIGAEEISKKGLGDVAAAVTKTTGISKQEGSSNIYVRGLGDRYNVTTLNGLPLPSNNPSSKNISLDIFSTDIVEFVNIDKTYNYKNLGDFSGANIDIVSKVYKGSGFLEVGVGSGINSNAQNVDKFKLQDGPEFHGFSNNKYPSNPFSGYNFTTKWNTSNYNLINSSVYVRGGESFEVGDSSKLSFFINVSHDNGYVYKEGVARGSVNVQGIAKKDLFRESYSYSTNSNAMANINYKINNNHNIRFNSLFINSSTQKHEEYNGVIDIFDIATNGGGFIRRSDFDRTSLLVNQLLGEHKLNERNVIDWGVSYNMMKNLVPDRMVNTIIPLNDEGNLDIKQVATNNESENHRFYSEMTDDEIAGNLNYQLKFKKNEDDAYDGKLNIGFSSRMKDVNFDATQFNFNILETPDNLPVVDPYNLDAFFNQQSMNLGYFQIKTFNGSSIPDGLRPQNFNGNQIISAGYIGTEYKFTDKLFVIAGLRGEYILQNIEYKTAIKQGKEDFDTVEILPMLTAKYELNEKNNLKLAASKTYTLPQIKERAPFQFEDVNQVYIGNPFLYNSTDYNFDLKWEYFPNKGEIVSLTTFGKFIQNPINEVTIASATNDISWVNSGKSATGFGAEFELRKNILKIENTENNKNTELTFGLNVSYMKTDQELDSAKILKETKNSINVFFTKEADNRLTGASDLLVNTDLSFSKDFSKNSSFTSTLSYSYFSDRVNAIGVYGKGSLIDSEVGTLDLILKYKLSENIKFGFNARNLTNPTIERFQEIQNVVIDSYKKGLNYSLSMSYSF